MINNIKLNPECTEDRLSFEHRIGKGLTFEESFGFNIFNGQNYGIKFDSIEYIEFALQDRDTPPYHAAIVGFVYENQYNLWVHLLPTINSYHYAYVPKNTILCRKVLGKWSELVSDTFKNIRGMGFENSKQ